MTIDPKAAAAALGHEAQNPISPPVWPAGAPVGEFLRSPAAARVGKFAAESGLFLFHYEHAAWRELPEDWVPPDRFDLAESPAWQGGILAERKYMNFRHDQAIGGFHPGQRAKWTAHEFCHGLIGHAWRSDASPLFLATASRLAELLPVVLWYFLDEVHLTRCPAHAEDGALFRAFCPACDRAARPRVEDPDAEQRLIDAQRYLDKELAAIAKTRRLGRPVPHTWATLDLASDGVAYAGAHGARLRSDVFRRFAEQFLVPAPNYHADLDSLEARVLEVAAALTGGPSPAPLAPSPAHGRARWMLQDVAWRLLLVRHETSGEAADTLDEIVDGLAEAIRATTRPQDPTTSARLAITSAAGAYGDLQDEWVLPPPEEVFATGFALPNGMGSHLAQLVEGVRSATPLVADLLEDELEPLVAKFALHDLKNPSREFLGARFAAFAAEPGTVGDLLRYEAAIATPPPGDDTANVLGSVGRDDRVRLADGLQIHRFGCNVLELAEQIDDVEIDDFPQEPTALILGRVGGDLLVLDVTPATADAIETLGEGAVFPMSADETASLRDLGVIVPAAWPETHGG